MMLLMIIILMIIVKLEDIAVTPMTTIQLLIMLVIVRALEEPLPAVDQQSLLLTAYSSDGSYDDSSPYICTTRSNITYYTDDYESEDYSTRPSKITRATIVNTSTSCFWCSRTQYLKPSN